MLDLSGLPLAVGDPPAPSTLALSAPTPNPARGDVRFVLDAPVAGWLTVDVFDVVGRRVRRVWAGSLGPGSHAMTWDSRDDAGRVARPGAYFVRASRTLGESVVRRVVKID